MWRCDNVVGIGGSLSRRFSSLFFDSRRARKGQPTLRTVNSTQRLSAKDMPLGQIHKTFKLGCEYSHVEICHFQT